MGLFDGNVDAISSSYFSPSPIRFKNARERRRMVNLQRLFALSVSFPDVRYFIDRLIELPENKLFFNLFKTYNHGVDNNRFYNAFTIQKPSQG